MWQFLCPVPQLPASLNPQVAYISLTVPSREIRVIVSLCKEPDPYWKGWPLPSVQSSQRGISRGFRGEEVSRFSDPRVVWFLFIDPPESICIFGPCFRAICFSTAPIWIHSAMQLSLGGRLFLSGIAGFKHKPIFTFAKFFAKRTFVYTLERII